MKLINIDDGTGKLITEREMAKIKKAIHDGRLSIDLGEATDRDGDICLEDGDYQTTKAIIQ